MHVPLVSEPPLHMHHAAQHTALSLERCCKAALFSDLSRSRELKTLPKLVHLFNMSFGFRVSDFVLVAEKAYKASKDNAMMAARSMMSLIATLSCTKRAAMPGANTKTSPTQS